MLAWFILGMARPDCFLGNRLATVVLWALVVVLFLAARVPSRPYAALILPPLLAVCWAGLRRSASTEPHDDLLDEMLGRIRPHNVIGLVLMPPAAIAVYAAFHGLHRHIPTNVLLYVITMPLGFVLFFRSLWVVFRTKAA